MKRIVLLVILVTLAAVAVMGDDVGQAVRTSTLTRAMLENLDLPEDQIQMILQLQNQYMLEKAERTGDINELKMKLTEEFNSSDPSTRKINRLVRKINQHNLDQDLDQVQLYQQTRQRFGEERWTEVVRGTNAHDPIRTTTEERVQVRDGSGDETPTQARTGESGSGGSGSGSNSGNGSDSSSGKK